MSVHVSSVVWSHSHSTGNARLILICLADQANDEGWCWPSIGNIMKRCVLDERTVQRRLEALEKSGEVTRHFRPGRSTMYRVEVEALLSHEPPPTPGASDTPVSLPGVSPVTPTPVTSVTPPPSPVTPRTVREPSREPLGANNGSNGRKLKGPQRLPEDWQPTDEHRERAAERDLDVDAEAENFRLHADANDRRLANWNSGFTMWLNKANGYTRGRPKVNGSHSPWAETTGTYSPWAV
jgi:hypothetical protein